MLPVTDREPVKHNSVATGGSVTLAEEAHVLVNGVQQQGVRRINRSKPLEGRDMPRALAPFQVGVGVTPQPCADQAHAVVPRTPCPFLIVFSQLEP